MKIEIFGIGCARCSEAHRNAQAAIVAAGRPIELVKVTSITQIIARDVPDTPAVAIDGRVMCSGRVPTSDEIRRWIEVAEDTTRITAPDS